MDWLFFVVFGPLTLASLISCREDAALRRKWRSPSRDLSAQDRKEFGRFVRSRELVPDARLIPVAVAWAEAVADYRTSCRWDRYLGWAWVAWITAGVVAAIAFGTARDVAVHLILFDVLLFGVAGWVIVRRRAHAVLAATGRA